MVATCALVAGVTAFPNGRHHHKPASTVVAAVPASTAAAASTATTAAAAPATAGQTIVLFEIGGVPGNECLTFRNNGKVSESFLFTKMLNISGEIVDAACVDTAADRQITPTTVGGQSVLLVQRSFSAGFRQDLVGVQACVGFNGTDFKAEPCGAAGITAVTLVGGELQAGTACASGHDGAAQLTIDPTGKNCAQYTSTDVTATPP